MSNSAQPLVSVIIPTHNRAGTLPRAIESALNQSYNNLEVLVVDDHSTDHTLTLAAKYKNAPVHFLTNKRRNGASGARNTGIRASRGNIIAFLDSDDQWIGNKLGRQVDLLSSYPTQVGAIFYGAESRYPGNRIFRSMPKTRGNIFRELLIRNNVGIRFLVRRTVLDEVGLFSEKYEVLNDWELVLRIARVYDIKLLPEFCVRMYYEGSNHLSSKSRELFLAHRRIFKTFEPTYRTRKRKGAHLGFLAYQLVRVGRRRLARRFLIQSLMLYPANRFALRLGYRLYIRSGLLNA